MTMQEWFYPASVILAGYLILGIIGFGSALVVVPLLAGQWPLTEVVALTILLDVPASIIHGGLNLKQVRWNELARLLPGMVAGTIAGLWLLGALDKRWPLFLLGLYVVFVGIRALLPKVGNHSQVASAWAHLAGGLIGIIEVMFATAGPIVVAWLQRKLNDVNAVRATVPVVMVLAGSIAIAVLLSTGQLDASTVLPRWLVGMPVAACGVILGNRIAIRIPSVVMKRLLAALLTVSGLSLMRSVWS